MLEAEFGDNTLIHAITNQVKYFEKLKIKTKLPRIFKFQPIKRK